MSRIALLAVGLVMLACQAAPGSGDLCSRASDCAAPLVCSRGRCRGGCTRSNDCPALARCLIDPATAIGTCSLDVDSCHSHPCPVGFLCREDECLNACGSIVQCPDGACVDGACVTLRGDAGIADGGVVVTPPPHITGLGAMGTHFCAIGTSNTVTNGVWCWGQARSFELGDGVITHEDCAACATHPTPALDAIGNPIADVDQVVGGPGFTCIRRGGNIECWGAFPAAATIVPTPHTLDANAGGVIAPIGDAHDLVAGIEHVCVRRGGTLDPWCAGINIEGRLGDGTTTSSADAVHASALFAGLELIPAWYHTLALGSDGAIHGVGNNDGMALGVADPSPILVAVFAMEPPARWLATANGTTCEVAMSDGHVGCWGSVGPLVAAGAAPMTCALGMCSLAPTSYAAPAGETIDGMVIAQGSPASAVCIWTAAGNAYCSGDSSIAFSLGTFAQVPGLSGVEEIVAGASAMCARTTDGTVWCWGANDVGQLGRGVIGSTVGDPRPGRLVWR